MILCWFAEFQWFLKFDKKYVEDLSYIGQFV